ncbi:MAG TPA: amino acid adenylation domain-containing protein, partial [Ktedonobacteraceae bacterium]|nr:amino acid adenylation domain-containing protein [Ktedonobacteraceae bacterium]
QRGRAGSQQSYVAPRTALERELTQIWSEVLGIEQIGVQDNFFESGGHSLKATQVLARVQQGMQVQLPLRSLFEEPTIAGLAQALEQAREQSQGGQAAIPRREDISADEQFEYLLAYLERISASELSVLLKDEGEKQCLLFPVSFSQQRMWVLDQLAPGTSTYTIAGAIRLLGELDQQALEHTLSELVDRHEALRTVFRAVGGRPVQLVLPPAPLKLAAEDLSALSEAERESQLQRCLLQEAARPFDLASGPLFRPSLFRLADRQHVLLLSVHHSVFDGWSQGVLLQEFMLLYEAFVAGGPSPLPPLPLQYADFARWQRSWFEKSAMREQLVFWQRQLAAPLPSLDLPVDRPRQPVQTFTGANFSFTLPVDETRALTALSQQQGVTLFTTLLAAFCILLARYSGQTDILVGTPVANRTRAELESLIGCFINTLVLRTQLADNPDLRTFLKRVQHVALEAYAHQDIPFEKIVEELAPQRDLSRSPFFQVMFVLQNAPQPPLALKGFTIENVSVPIQIAKFDLTLYIIENEQGLQAHFEYNTDLFEETTIARMAVHFQRVLQAVLSNLDCTIGDVPLLTSQERQHLLITLNRTAQPFPDQSCLHHLIEAQVALAPDAQALRFADRTLTYQQLDHRANQLAHYLQAQGIGPDCLVGIYLPRSFEMVIAILATLKAGGAYLPLDSSYPAERLAFMIQDAQAVLILTQESLLQRLPPLSTPLLCLDRLSQSLALQPITPCKSLTLSEHLAYVIYTSGSTGRPKGTMIPHRGLVNYLSWAGTAYQVAQGEGCPVHSSLSFDLTVTSLFLPLLSQRCVTLLPDEPEDLEQLGQLFTVERDYSLLKITPAHLALLRQQVDLRQAANGVRRLVVGGEPLQAESLQGWLLANPNLSIVNEYGPTETVVGCCIYAVDGQTTLNGPVPIGRPIANTQLYLLDAHLQPTPIGVAGELYIAGAGLARGYLNRPDQTAERFLPHPFSASPGARMYRTGDLARYQADGTLEYVGRLDQQVKIRGYRIELGEIEAVLRQHPQVEDAVVLAREDRPGDKRLVAYVVNKEHDQDDSMLRNYLRTHIPEYMIPSTILFLPQLPLTSNGKVDLRALPIPDKEKATQGYVAPSTPLEEQLAQIWAEVLGLERVGIHDNFFELGGHSLQAAQILAYMREKLQKGLSLSSFFKTQTIAEVAILLEARKNADTPILIPLRETGARPPLYCFHPAGGEVVMYQELAACLDKDQPIYGVQSQALEGMHPEYESIEAMAHEYALALRQHQPEGPYYLLGWSMGGVIAVAVASELERANQEIAFVGLLDAYLTSPELVQGQQADELEGLGVIIEVALTKTFVTLSLEEQQATRESILALPRQERLPQVLKWGKERKLLPESLSLEILQLQEALVNTHLDLVNAYQAPVVETPLVVWRACEVAFVAQAQTPWQNYTRGGIQEIPAKGNHFTMIKPPHIQTLAQQIEGILNASLANKAVARE